MKTIVMNTLNGAVTEYDAFDFQSVTPTHAGSATGLFAFGGKLDLDQPIRASVRTGKVHWGATLKRMLDKMFFGVKSTGTLRAVVEGERNEYAYPFTVNSGGVSSAKPGRGIKENYMAFGLENPSGQDFELDRIDILDSTSTNRRAAS